VGNGRIVKIEIFREVNVSLTKDSQRKQIIGIILVIVFLLAIFVYGTRAYRPGDCPSDCKQTCQAENGSCPVETKTVQ
jgi:hypothetical protein